MPHILEPKPTKRFWKVLEDWISACEPETTAKACKLVMKRLRNFSQETIHSVTSFEYLMSAWKEAIA